MLRPGTWPEERKPLPRILARRIVANVGPAGSRERTSVCLPCSSRAPATSTLGPAWALGSSCARALLPDVSLPRARSTSGAVWANSSRLAPPGSLLAPIRSERSGASHQAHAGGFQAPSLRPGPPGSGPPGSGSPQPGCRLTRRGVVQSAAAAAASASVNRVEGEEYCVLLRYSDQTSKRGLSKVGLLLSFFWLSLMKVRRF